MKRLAEHLYALAVRTVIVMAGLLLLIGCSGEATLPQKGSLTYQITRGACGTVVYVASIGSDSASAFRAVETKKRQQYEDSAIALNVSPLDVVDARGESPEESFYAIHVLDAQNGMHIHSVSEVITTQGDLYGLRWCDD